jgi:cysteine desulfurase
MYLDHASTTPPSPAVLDLYTKINRELYANPASLHTQGILAEREIAAATKKLAKLLGAAPEEIIYTSGGTESDNLAIFGACEATKTGRHIITTRSEHPAVTEPFKRMEKKGFEISWLNTDSAGYINLSELDQAVRQDTALVSLAHVNNETGAVCDIAAAAEIVKAKNKATVFHSDGVQALGKFPVALKNIDLYSMSAHKIGGLRGIGALYIKKGTRITPQIYGGGQQRELRSGTENTAGVCAFVLALEQAYQGMEKNREAVSRIKAALADIALPDVFINGDPTGSPYILNMSFLGVKAQVLADFLAQDNIYASTGSACGSKNNKNILIHYGVGSERAESALRFSFSHENTIDEAEAVKEALVRHVRHLRTIKR